MSTTAEDLASRLLNTQEYENSPLCGSKIEQDYEANPDRLFGDKKPNFAILSEKPEHRVIVFLKGQGLSNTEIAQKTGYQIAWVGQILRQPWARERLIAEIQEAGRDAVSEVIKASALDSVWKQIDMRDDPKTPPAVVHNICNSLLDRHLGKAVQRIEQDIVSRTGKLDSPEAIAAELERLKAEEATLKGNATNN